ncbi:MAG: hypothetical protein NTV86_09205, partial [Planctomycetota bacterium]|nr:hypothetical protein [Planctomycetota bacterium]
MARHDRFRRSKGRQLSEAAGVSGAMMEGLEPRILFDWVNVVPGEAPAGRVLVTSAQDVVDWSQDGINTLREAILAANANDPSVTLLDEFGHAVYSTSGGPLGDRIAITDATVASDGIFLTQGELAVTDWVNFNGGGVEISGTDEIRIFNVTAPGVNLTLTDMTLTNGLGLGGGGAIRMSGGGTLTIVDCTIQNSYASSAEGSPPAWGGGILNLGSTVTISTTSDPTASVITGNGAVDGGGIYSVGGTVNLIGVDVSSNTASRRGAGIYMDGGTLNLTAASTGELAAPVMVPTTITNNAAATLGGGLFADEATVTTVGATFSTNTALDGGGMYLTGSQANIGVLVNARGVALLTGEINDNIAERYGGGLFMYDSEVAITGSGILIPDQGTPDVGRVNITGNTAVNGGGIYQDRGTLSLQGAAIIDNSVTSMPLVGVPVSIDGTVAATEDASGKITGTITGTITVSGVTGDSGSLGTFTADAAFLTDTVTITVTINSTVVGTFDCTLTLALDATTPSPTDYIGTFTGAGVIIGSGAATLTGAALPADPNGLTVTMSATATLTGPSSVPSTGLGGGIFATNGTTTSRNLRILSNTATAGTSPLPVLGGGIYALYHHLKLVSTVIDDNSAEGNGGGIFLEHSSATLSQVTLGTNSATVDPEPTPDDEAITGGVIGGAIGYGTVNATFTGGGGAAQPLSGSVRGIGTGTFQGVVTVNGLIVGVVSGTITVSPLGTGNITGS